MNPDFWDICPHSFKPELYKNIVKELEAISWILFYEIFIIKWYIFYAGQKYI